MSQLHPWEISPQDVAALHERGERFVFIDCRTPEEHEECRIDGTRLMPLQGFDAHLPELSAHKDDLIVVHCRSGKRSMTITTVLRADGFNNVKSMAGGIQRWENEGGRVIRAPQT
jgi:rhodanese-related sulfurtransferase